MTLLTPELMARARSSSESAQSTAVQRLQELARLSPDEVMAALGEQFGCPVLSMRSLQATTPLFDRIPYTEGMQRQVLAVRDEAGRAHLVLGDPFDGATEEWALRRWGVIDDAPSIALAHPEDLQAFFAQLERQMRAINGFDGNAAAAGDEEVAAVITLASIGDDASPVVKLVNSTIYDALKLQASDIHLECDAGCLHVLYRIDGVLVPITQAQGHDMAEQIISRVKVMAELDIAERRVPQDGRFKVRVNAREIDFGCR